MRNLRTFDNLGNVDSIVLGQAAGVEHVSFYSRTELLIFPYNEPWTQRGVNNSHRANFEANSCFVLEEVCEMFRGRYQNVAESVGSAIVERKTQRMSMIRRMRTERWCRSESSHWWYRWGQNEVRDREKRPVKPAKRHLSDQKPICTIDPYVKTNIVPPKTKRRRVSLQRKKRHTQRSRMRGCAFCSTSSMESHIARAIRSLFL